MTIRVRIGRSQGRNNWLRRSARRGVRSARLSDGHADVGDELLEASSFHPLLAARLRPRLTDYALPETLRRHGGEPDVRLPADQAQQGVGESLVNALLNRKTDRSHAGTALALTEVGFLLHHGLGLANGRPRHGLRAYPSGGGLYPVVIHVVARNVSGLPAGGYRVRGDGNLDKCAIWGATHEALWKGYFRDGAACVFMLSAHMQHTRQKYGATAYRLALLEAGHIAQNLLLLASTLCIKAAPLCSFVGDFAKDALRMEGQRTFPLYAIELGK